VAAGFLLGIIKKEFIGFGLTFNTDQAIAWSSTKIFFTLKKTNPQIFTLCGKYAINRAQPLSVVDLGFSSHVLDYFFEVFFGNISISY